MTKTLELQFVTAEGRTTRLAIDNPKEPVNINELNDVMDQVIADNIFYTDYGDLVAKKGARVIERTVTDYNLN